MFQHDYLMNVASSALQTALTPAEGREKEAFRQELEKVAQSAIAKYDQTTVNPKSVRLKCYGSLANGFAVEGSDLDLLLTFPRGGEPLGPIETDCKRLLEQAFLDSGYGARLLTNTRVPILRVCQQPSPELLEKLRRYRSKWDEEGHVATERDRGRDSSGPLNSSRLPELTTAQSSAATKAFAELDLSPTEIPLPPSPVRENASLEFKGDVGIHCDINFSNYVAIHNTTLLRCYCKCDPRVRDMGLFIKAWAKARQINTTYYGTLSSYGYILMVLHYLMNVARPPVIPNLQHMARDADAWAGKTEIELFEGFDVRFNSDEQWIEKAAKAGQMTENKQSLGALLHGFFWYYTDRQGFHWQNEVISIRTVGGIITKQSKGWTEAKWTGDNNQVRQRYLLAIEDPFEVGHNIARTVGHSGIVAIRNELRRAWDIIGKVRPVHGIGWQWYRPDGSVGEELLARAEDRGDLLGQDQDYHRKKQQEVRAALAAKKAQEEDTEVKSQEAAAVGNIGASGMSSKSSPIRTNEGGPPTKRSNTKLMRSPKSQLTPKQGQGRRRKVMNESDNESGDDINGVPNKLSSERVPSVPTSDGKSVLGNKEGKDCENAVKSIEHDLDELTSQETESDKYCPVFDPELLYATVPLRIEDVCVRPGSHDDGKPLAWNVDTQAGRWLTWRDNKIRRGQSDHSKFSQASFLGYLNRLFPYDPNRPVTWNSDSKRHQKHLTWVREKRMAYFANRNSSDPANSFKEEFLEYSDLDERRSSELPRKDSAISGMTDQVPGKRSQRGSEPSTRQTNSHATKHIQPTESDGETEKDASKAVSETPTPPGNVPYDMSVPPRDEDPSIMPIPPIAGFRFDPRQLRDLDIIKQGGNGCARDGEQWNVEIEGEWGGGGYMGALRTSSGLVTTRVGVSCGDNGWEYDRGDDEGLLGELPDFEAVEV